MSGETRIKAPTWFLIVSVAALIWNLMGVVAYVTQIIMTPEMLAALPRAERELIANTPEWATAAFAVAVNGGALGCLLLILKKNLAGLFLQISLAGVAVQMFHSFIISNSFAVYGPGGAVMPVMVVAVAVYLVTLAASAKVNLWTR